jgi:hypothetical protein
MGYSLGYNVAQRFWIFKQKAGTLLLQLLRFEFGVRPLTLPSRFGKWLRRMGPNPLPDRERESY